MKTNSKSKIILSSIGILVVGLFLYNFLMGSNAMPETDNLSAISVGSDLILILESLEKITLDRGLFSEPKFLELSDFSTVIPQQPTGRANPFNVIGRN